MLPKSPVTGTYARLELRGKIGTGKEVTVLSAQKWLKLESGADNTKRALKSAGLSPRVHSHLKEVERKIIHPFCRGLTNADPEQSQPGVGSSVGVPRSYSQGLSSSVLSSLSEELSPNGT